MCGRTTGVLGRRSAHWEPADGRGDWRCLAPSQHSWVSAFDGPDKAWSRARLVTFSQLQGVSFLEENAPLLKTKLIDLTKAAQRPKGKYHKCKNVSASYRNVYQGKVVASLLPSEWGKPVCKDFCGSNYSENCLFWVVRKQWRLLFIVVLWLVMCRPSALRDRNVLGAGENLSALWDPSASHIMSLPSVLVEWTNQWVLW